MASFPSRRDLNTSIVSDLSALNDGDFNMIVEQLLCKPKKSKRTKKQYHRKVQTAQSVPALNAVNLFDAHDEVDDGAMNATFSPELANASFISFNDTCTTVNSEQHLENIFAYFDQDVTANDLLLSDDDSDDCNESDGNVAAIAAAAITATDVQTQRSPTSNGCEQFTSNLLQNLLPTAKPKSKKKQLQQRAETKEIQCKSKAILNRIQQFNRIESKNDACIGTKPSYIQKNRPASVLSTSSTASLHDSDSDTAFKKPNNVVKNGNVRSKVAFFSDHSSSDRSSSTSPSIQSTISDDDDYQFQRSQSKRNFQRNRNFFENFFKDKNPDQSSNDVSINCDEKKSIDTAKSDAFFRTATVSNDQQIDVHEKLKAVQTYVQTQYLLERIERLVSAISNLDETRLSSMNLKLLKKFLTFIRDCSYNCTEVCNSISEHVLTDFEKNVMSAEELLYSALKEAQTAQVYIKEYQTRR